MLRVLTKTFRRRAGLILALAYLACVTGPAVALAWMDGAAAAHCLTADHRTAAVVHVHADGTEHRHEHRHDHSGSSHDHSGAAIDPTDADDNGDVRQCCGLFCLNAATDGGCTAVAGAPIRAQILHPTLEAALAGIGPFRIDRPPNALASL